MHNNTVITPVFETLEPRVLLSTVVENIESFNMETSEGAAYIFTGPEEVAILPAEGIQNFVNVQDYGALGNGYTDDTAAIQAALNTGLPIFIPKTNNFYKITSALTYSGNNISSDGARLRAAYSSFHLLAISNVTGLYVGDVTLEYPIAQSMRGGPTLIGYNPLTLDNVSGFTIERVIAKNGGAIEIKNSDNGIVRQCQMLNAAYSGFIMRSSSEILVEECYAKTAVQLFSTENARHISFINNTASDAAWTGFRIEDSANITIQGNVLRDCINGVMVYGPQTGEGTSIYTTDIYVTGNTFYHCYKNLTVDKDESYTNNMCEFTLATKMDIGNVTFKNNIIIGKDESTLLTDLNSNVVFNTNIGLDQAYVSRDTIGTSYFTMVPYANYIKLTKNDRNMPMDWLFYVNFPSGVDASAEDLLTMDFYWGSTEAMHDDTMAVNLYSGLDRTGFLCQIPLYNYSNGSCLPVILRIPDGIDASDIKCIDLEKIGDRNVSIIAVSEICKGLNNKVGYIHSYINDDVQNAVLDSNIFVDVKLPYVNRKYEQAPAPTIIPGTGITGTTAERPTNPEIGWRYYDTTIEAPIYWDGESWIDINTYWLNNIVTEAIRFDRTNFVNLGNDDRVELDHYTIAGWVKAADNNFIGNIIDRQDSNGGYLMTLLNDNYLMANQSANGNPNALSVTSPFPSDDKYHHIAMSFSYDGNLSTLQLYLDGALVDTASVVGTPDYPAIETSIICGECFAGNIADFLFYTRTLDGMEISDSYRRSDYYVPKEPKAHYIFKETAPGNWEVLIEISGDETAGLSSYEIWVDIDPQLVIFSQNTLATIVNLDAYTTIGFSESRLSQGNVDGSFNAGNYQNSGDQAILGIGLAEVYQAGYIPGSTPLVHLSVPALLGVLNTPTGLTATDFRVERFGVLDETGDGFLNTLDLTPIGEVIQWLAGDANGDGVVSSSDYASIRANFGHTGIGILGDANGDGVVSADDFGSVQANFGAVAISTMIIQKTLPASTLSLNPAETENIDIVPIESSAPVKIRTKATAKKFKPLSVFHYDLTTKKTATVIKKAEFVFSKPHLYITTMDALGTNSLPENFTLTCEVLSYLEGTLLFHGAVQSE